ncbi:hypothetical protein GCM10010214_03050 [Streptomyces abikoensis]|nr:hypothetical protein GCM10010214_03050 [Streptomyces abikoensis]
MELPSTKASTVILSTLAGSWAKERIACSLIMVNSYRSRLPRSVSGRGGQGADPLSGSPVVGVPGIRAQTRRPVTVKATE